MPDTPDSPLFSSPALDAANAELDRALHRRVSLHTARAGRRITVAEYLTGLGEVREVENRLDPIRRSVHGRRMSRALELCVLDGAVTAAQASRIMDGADRA